MWLRESLLGGDSSYSSNGGSIPQGRVFGGKPQETEITRGLDNQGVVTYQREALKGLSWSLSLLRGVAFIKQLTFFLVFRPGPDDPAPAYFNFETKGDCCCDWR